MEGKLEVNKKNGELEYELTVRGVTDQKTVREMRMSLRACLKLEASGERITYPTYPYSFAEDVEYVKGKISVLKSSIEEFCGSDTSPDYAKINTKLLHAYFRMKRALPTGNEDSGQVSQLFRELVTLQSSLKSRARKFAKAAVAELAPIDFTSLIFSSSNVLSSGDEISDSDE
ncbi:hypothetical protein QE152_g29248 [Popillia japonica]|uniref:Uncharacterized protein n=1 Tax=Popillia japonica TaxID=7064 RepID=A0AAW1JIB7_POPJA